jgi:hypothetical protein
LKTYGALLVAAVVTVVGPLCNPTKKRGPTYQPLFRFFFLARQKYDGTRLTKPFILTLILNFGLTLSASPSDNTPPYRLICTNPEGEEGKEKVYMRFGLE